MIYSLVLSISQALLMNRQDLNHRCLLDFLYVNSAGRSWTGSTRDRTSHLRCGSSSKPLSHLTAVQHRAPSLLFCADSHKAAQCLPRCLLRRNARCVCVNNAGLLSGPNQRSDCCCCFRKTQNLIQRPSLWSDDDRCQDSARVRSCPFYTSLLYMKLYINVACMPRHLVLALISSIRHKLTVSWQHESLHVSAYTLRVWARRRPPPDGASLERSQGQAATSAERFMISILIKRICGITVFLYVSA